MTAVAKKSQAPQDLASDYENDEITIERRVRSTAGAPTVKLAKIDERLLAIARGELDPDDPFGGLIPIYDDELANEVEDGWMSLEPSPASAEEKVFSQAIPSLRKSIQALLALPISEEAMLFVAQVDGARSIAELADACRLEELDSLEIIDELLRAGAIELR